MTLRTRLLLPTTAILLAALLASIMAATREVVKVVDTVEDSLYQGKLAGVLSLLGQREQRLVATGMRAVYEESFHQSTLATLRSAYLQGDRPDFPFVIGPDGHLLLYPASFPALHDIAALAGRQAGTATLTAADGRRVWVAFAPFRPWQWTVGWAVPEKVKYAPVNELQQRLLLILGTAFLLVAAFLAACIRRVIRPVEELTAAAAGMTRGELDRPIPIPTGGRDEVGILARALETMRQRLREKIGQLAASERNYRELVQGANAIVLRWDRDGRILFMNDYGLRLFGFTREELVGRHVVGTIVPERGADGTDLARMIDDIIRHPGDYQLNENENRTKDGRRLIVQWTNRAVTDDDGELVELLSVGTDVTEQRRLEAELRQAQKLEAIGTLAGGIAHDFNNILTAIFGFTELAMMEAAGNPTLRHLLDQQLTAARRARDLVRQILAFSRRSEQAKSPLQISLLVKETLKLLRASLPATIDIRAEITSSATILADPTQIHQMLMNLATNALHAMEERGGRLSFTLDETEIGQEEAAEGSAPRLPAGRYLRLTVSDTGCGIDQEHLDKIFEPYFTTKEPGKGTGLGLAVVHGIVRTHGGVIQVDSTPGRGSTFTVLLPLAPAAEAETHPLAPGEPAPAGTIRQARIMVVDDEESVRFLLQEFLARAGHQPATFASPRKALDAFRRDPAAWDLVITDLTMPGGTGLDLAGKLRAIRKDIPIVLCTGQSERVDAGRLEALAIDATLRKPLLQQELLRVVGRTLDSEMLDSGMLDSGQTSCRPRTGRDQNR